MLDGVFKTLRRGDRDRLGFTPVEVRMVMDRAYDQKYDIAKDDVFDVRLMPGVAYYWTEDPLHFSGLREKLGLFLNYEIHRHTGLDFMEYMDQPRWFNELLVSECRRYIDRKAAEQANILRGGGQHSDSPSVDNLNPT